MVCYGLLWSAMVPERYPIWSPQGQSTRITNHDPWYSVIKSRRTEHDGTTSDHVGPLSEGALRLTHTVRTFDEHPHRSHSPKNTCGSGQTMSNRSPTNTCGVHGCMVVSWQAVALDISVTLRGCKGSRRIMKAYEIRYCPGLPTRNQQGLWLKMWASWFNTHVIHRHTLDKNIQDVQDVQVPH